MHKKTHKLPPIRAILHQCTLTHTLVVMLTSPEHLGKPLSTLRALEQLDILVIQTAGPDSVVLIFFLCLLCIDVDNHPLSGLSQEGSYFLPVQGIFIMSLCMTCLQRREEVIHFNLPFYFLLY